MSAYTNPHAGPDELLNFLDVVWKQTPRIRSDAARFYVYEAAQAACQGLVTTWQGSAWGNRWLITTAGLKKLSSTPLKRTRRTP